LKKHMFVVLDAIWRPFFYLLFNQTLLLLP